MSRPPLTAAAEYAQAAGALLARHWDDEVRAFPLRRWRLGQARLAALLAAPHDPRPPELETGRALLSGRMTLAGAVLDTGPGGDPWDTPSPTRRFAVALHRFTWLPALLAQGAAGAREALRLSLDWEGLFGGWNAFAWSADVLERRVFNLACGLGPLLAAASDAEGERLRRSVFRQARDLLTVRAGPLRAAERAAAAATAGAALDRDGALLLAPALERLGRALGDAVLPDGVHRSRSPQAGLELLLDLLALDDALQQRGRPSPGAVARSLDRLTSAARFFTLGDGRLAAFQGGEAADAERVRAARRLQPEEAGPPPTELRYGGYQRLQGRRLQLIVDVGAPAAGPWSVTAADQAGAVEITAGRDRLIVGVGWSPDADGPAAYRGAVGASAAALGGTEDAPLLAGLRASGLGPRLIGGAEQASVSRQENGPDTLVELRHDAWLRRCGHEHERRLYLAAEADELRGEDRFIAQSDRVGPTPLVLRFHLAPEVRAAVARDGRSVALRTPTGGGWRLRTDAPAVALEPSVAFQGGEPRRTQQLVLRSQLRSVEGARIRWKLGPADDR